MFFDPWYFVILAPALILGLWAQARVRSTFAEAERVRAAERRGRCTTRAGLGRVT